jgi:hypothetical protein
MKSAVRHAHRYGFFSPDVSSDEILFHYIIRATAAVKSISSNAELRPLRTHGVITRQGKRKAVSDQDARFMSPTRLSESIQQTTRQAPDRDRRQFRVSRPHGPEDEDCSKTLQPTKIDATDGSIESMLRLSAGIRT